MLDVDHFKSVNDTRGHPAGDRILKGLGAFLAKAVRENDVVGRYGGEEFVVLLPHTGIESTLEVAERIRLGIGENSPAWDPEVGGVTASIGAVHVSPSASDINADGLIAEADKCLYAAKGGGRNCTRYADLNV